jgi:cytochrome c peroxidase
VQVLAANPFNLQGAYADATGGPFATPDEVGAVDGAFRTPSLRRSAETAPYGHDGSFATLDDLLAEHAAGLSDPERLLLVAFLRTLTADLPPRPWSFWPQPQ